MKLICFLLLSANCSTYLFHKHCFPTTRYLHHILPLGKTKIAEKLHTALRQEKHSIQYFLHITDNKKLSRQYLTVISRNFGFGQQ